MKLHVSVWTNDKFRKKEKTKRQINSFSIYSLIDLGDLNKTDWFAIFDYSTINIHLLASRYIMCELCVFPIFLENDLLKLDKILGL